MSQLHSTTTSHKKRKHLSFEERVIIQLRINLQSDNQTWVFWYTSAAFQAIHL